MPLTSRNLYYYGVELMNHGLLDLAFNQFYKCIDDCPQDGYHNILSLRELLLHYAPKSLEYSYKLLERQVWRKDLFVYLGNYYYFKLNNQIFSKMFYLDGLNFPDPDPMLMFQYHHGCVIDALLQLGIIEYNLGNPQGCVDYNQKVLEIDPSNDTAIKNLDILSTMV